MEHYEFDSFLQFWYLDWQCTKVRNLDVWRSLYNSISVLPSTRGMEKTLVYQGYYIRILQQVKAFIQKYSFKVIAVVTR